MYLDVSKGNDRAFSRAAANAQQSADFLRSFSETAETRGDSFQPDSPSELFLLLRRQDAQPVEVVMSTQALHHEKSAEKADDFHQHSR
jgi:hypothetical protein